MAFWKRKNAPNANPAHSAPAPPSPSTDAETKFLSGDALKDRRSVEVLLDAIKQVSESRDLESLLDYVVDRSIEVTGAERGMLVLIDDAGAQQVRVARQAGGYAADEGAKYSTNVVKRVLEDNTPMRTTVQSDAEALELGASVFDLKLRAVMCVPLIADEQEAPEDTQRGALYVDSKAASRAFTDEDLSLFFALAKHIAIALENARLTLQSLENAKYQQSLDIAGEIQKGLMPKSPKSIPGYDVFGWYRSAEHASGDFYDFVHTRDKRMAVVVGDVSGHGIGPALITATAQASLRALMKVVGTPGEAINMLNEDMAERMDDGMFLTLFIAYFSTDGTVQVINAGHTPPLIWRQRTGEIERIDGHGPAVGMVDDFDYSESPLFKLDPGDLILAYTDGLVEARHESRPDRFFDESGVRRILSEVAPRGTSTKELTEELVRHVLEFAGGVREDDWTVVAVRRTGRA